MIALISRLRFVAILLVCLLVVIPPTSADAQQSAITFRVVAGYEGAFQVGEWFPVQVVVANNGPDVRGQVVFRFTGFNSRQFAYEIDLPQGAQKQITIYAVARDLNSGNGQVVLEADGRELATQDVRLEPLSGDQLLVVVASSDPALLNSLSGLTTTYTTSAFVQHVDLATLPEQTQGLDGVNALFIHNVDTAILNERQRIALSLWVQRGGRLVVSGGANATQTAAGLADLLPVQVSNGFQQASLEPLATNNASTEGLPASTSVNQVQPQPRATALFSSDPAQALGFQRLLGQGRVIFTTFDLAALRGWGGETQLWEDTLELAPRTSFNGVRLNLLADALRSNSVSLISAWALLGLLALYILVVGPINYVVLRRLNKLEWAWGTIPLVVFTFVFGIYLAGRVMRGNEARLSIITIVQAGEGDQRGVFAAYTGLFSPDRARYTFTYPTDTLLQEVQSFDDFSTTEGQFVASDTATEVRDVLVDIRSICTILSESTGETGIAVESNLQTTGSTVRGDLRYNGTIPLQDVVIVRGDSFQNVGALETGTTTNINLNSGTASFPWSLELEQVASIDRKTLLTRINDISQSREGIIDPEGVYIVGWRNTPTVDVRINGTERPSEGVTLYIVRLNS